MQKTVSKVSEVLEIKELATGVLLKCDSSQSLENVKIQAFLVDQNFTKKEFIPTLKLSDYLKILGVHLVNLQKDFDSKRQVLVPFSKGGSLALNDHTYIEFHLTNSDGASKAIEVLTYENIGKSEPLVIQPIKLDANVSVKDIDVFYYDYFVGLVFPNELQAIIGEQRTKFEKTILKFDANTRREGYSDACSLGLQSVHTLSVYKNAGEDYTFYLLDIV